MLVCHLLGQPALRIKLYSLSQHLISWIYWPAVGEQSEPGLGNSSFRHITCGDEVNVKMWPGEEAATQTHTHML